MATMCPNGQYGTTYLHKVNLMIKAQGLGQFRFQGGICMPVTHKKNNDEKNNQAAEAARTARIVADETANAGQHATQAGAEIARSNVETMQQAVQSSLNMAAQVAEHSVEQFTSIFGLSDERAEETAQQSSRNIEAIAECNTVLARGSQDISREWVSLAQDRLRRNLDAF